jgi:ATP-binding cassette subfamily B protein
MEEAISGQRVVKAFRRDESATEAFRKHNQEVYKSAVYANSYALLLMPLSNQLGNLFVITIAGLGGVLALKGLVTIGTIVTFISYGRSFVGPLQQLHPGRARWFGTRLRDHRHPFRSGRRARSRTVGKSFRRCQI